MLLPMMHMAIDQFYSLTQICLNLFNALFIYLDIQGIIKQEALTLLNFGNCLRLVDRIISQVRLRFIWAHLVFINYYIEQKFSIDKFGNFYLEAWVTFLCSRKLLHC